MKMWLNRSTVNTAVTLLLFCYTLIPCRAQPRIVLGPSSQTVDPSMTVELSCLVEDKTSEYLVAWFRDEQRITRINNESLDSLHVETSRYSLIGDWGQGNYSLRIRDIKSTDAHSFACAIMSQRGFELLRSQAAVITVQYPPDQYSFSCYPGNTRNLRVGTPLNISCVSAKGYPVATLSWSLASSVVNATLEEAPSHITLSFTEKIDIADNGKTFTCELTQSKLTQPRMCIVGPLDVLYEPMDVAITTEPSSALLPDEPRRAVVNVNDRLSFRCSGRANPEMDVTWTVEQAPGCTKDLQHEVWMGVLLLSKATMAYDGATITCTAHNSVGTVSTSVTLSVESGDSNALCYSTTSKPATTVKVTPPKPSPVYSQLSTMNIIIIIIAVAFLIIIAILVYMACSRRRETPIQLHVAGPAEDARSLSEASIIFHSRHNTPDPERGNSLSRMQSNFSTMSYDTHSIDSATALMHLKSMESPEYKANPKLTGSPTRKLKGEKEFRLHEMDTSPFRRFEVADNTYDSSPKRAPPTSTPKSTITRQPSEHKYEECPPMKKYTTHASQTDLTLTADMLEEREEVDHFNYSSDDDNFDSYPQEQNFSVNNCNIGFGKHTEV